MKILYCIPELHLPAGMERIISSKINCLASVGHEVVVVTTDGKGNKPYFPIHESVRIIDLGLNYIDDRGLNPIKWRIQRNIKLRKHKKMLAKVLRNERPDVSISTFEQETHILYKLPYTGKKILEFHFVRNQRSLEPRKGIRKYVDRYLDFKDGRVTKKYDAFVVLTDRDRKAWPYKKNIHVIPNFITKEPDLKTKNPQKIVIAAGRMKEVKGFSRLLKIWKLVVEKHPDWKLRIFGQGELYQSLKREISELGLEQNAELLAPVENFYKPLSEGSIYAMTSYYEGFSMVLIEAFAFGIPVVAFNVDCGPSSLVKDGRNGFLVEDNNLEQFADRINQLIENKELRMRLSNGALNSSESFNKDKVMQLWLDLFSK